MHHLIVLLVAALVPLVVGAAWYSPMLFAKPWMAAVGITPEQQRQGNMLLNMLGLYVLSILVASGLQFMVIHQWHMASILMNEPGFKNRTGDTFMMYQNFMHTYGSRFRSYRHGAFHGTLAAFAFALPLIGSSAIFEKRGIKYVLITFGFWLINFIIMGAIICHWAPERFAI